MKTEHNLPPNVHRISDCIAEFLQRVHRQQANRKRRPLRDKAVKTYPKPMKDYGTLF